MYKTFTYFEENGDNFEYNADIEEVLKEVVDIVFKYYFNENEAKREKSIKKSIKSLILDVDALDSLIEIYEEDLKERFREYACEDWR